MAWRAAACVLTPGSTPLIKIVMPVLNQSIWHFGNTQVSGHFIYTAFSLLFSFGNGKVQGGDSHRVSLLCLPTVKRKNNKVSFNSLNKYKNLTIIAICKIYFKVTYNVAHSLKWDKQCNYVFSQHCRNAAIVFKSGLIFIASEKIRGRIACYVASQGEWWLVSWVLTIAAKVLLNLKLKQTPAPGKISSWKLAMKEIWRPNTSCWDNREREEA